MITLSALGSVIVYLYATGVPVSRVENGSVPESRTNDSRVPISRTKDSVMCDADKWRKRRANPHGWHGTNTSVQVGDITLKRGYIEFKYYADAIHSDLTPPG